MPGTGNKYGVLLLNMGGPADLDGVQDYIYQLLADPDMVKFPGSWLVRKPLAKLISVLRAPKVKKRYTLIGGSSPIGPATSSQADLLQQTIELPVSFAMRYTPPSAGSALDELAQTGAQRLIVIPLYPQYSTVSTLSSVKDFNRFNRGRIESRIVEQHYDDSNFIAAMREKLRDTLSDIDPTLKTHLLFTAHSIPEAYVRAGDPYASQIEQTAQLISDGFDSLPPQSLAYQSQVGPVEWRGPTFEETLVKLKAQGVQQLVVHCLSFVSENLETLWDLDYDFKAKCASEGITAFHRVPTVESSPLYIESLAGLARRAIEQWEGDSA